MTTLSTESELRRANVALVARYFELMNALDIDSVEALLHPDVEYELPYAIPGTPDSFAGKQTVVELLHAVPSRLGPLGFHEIEISTLHEPNELVVEYRGNAPVLGTDRVYANRYITRISIVDGQIRRFTEFGNPLIQMEAFGIAASD